MFSRILLSALCLIGCTSPSPANERAYVAPLPETKAETKAEPPAAETPVWKVNNRITDGGAPSIRTKHVAVWTGTHMIVWGGDGSYPHLNPYDANSEVIRPKFFQPPPKPLRDGGIYDPFEGTWEPLPTHGAPPAAYSPMVAWTGSEMLVWGGESAPGHPVADGGAFDPATRTWRPLPSADAPLARSEAKAVWTGSEFIIWGGREGEARGVSTGARYWPKADRWLPMTLSEAPAPRWGHSLVWTNEGAIVWGGRSAKGELADGARYDAAKNAWFAISAEGTPTPRGDHLALYDGERVLVWGGRTGRFDPRDKTACTMWLDGGVYDVATDSWAPLNAALNPGQLEEGPTSCESEEFGRALWTGEHVALVRWSEAFDGPLAVPDGFRQYGANSFWHFSVVLADDRLLTWGGLMDTGSGNDGLIVRLHPPVSVPVD